MLRAVAHAEKRNMAGMVLVIRITLFNKLHVPVAASALKTVSS